MSSDVSTTHEFTAYNPIVLVALSIVLGTICDRTLDIHGVLSCGLVVLGLVAWIGLYRAGYWRAASCAMLLAMVGLGGFWHHVRWNFYPSNHIGCFVQQAPEPVVVRAIVGSEPRRLAGTRRNDLNPIPGRSRTRIALNVTHVRDAGRWRAVSGICDLIVYGDSLALQDSELGYGDEIRVAGRLVRISESTNPGQFDFRRFYRVQSKIVTLHAFSPNSVRVVRRTREYSQRWLLTRLRQRLNRVIWNHVSESRAGLASAIMLGNREQLTNDRREKFLYTGTVHLLAISGLHVGILAALFFWMFRFGVVNRNTALLGTVCFVIAYTWLVEFRPPVTRAAVLLTLICLGRLNGKSGFSFNMLGLAGIVVLAMNPSELFQLGTQLSFLAVGTIIVFRESIFAHPSDDPLDRLIRNTRPNSVRFLRTQCRRIRQIVMVSGLIWVVAVPLVAYRFHLVAPAALGVNPFVVAPITVALYGGLGVMVFGGWFPIGADLSGAMCEAGLTVVERIIESTQGLPLAFFWTSGPSGIATSVFYVGFFLSVIFLSKKARKKWLPVLAITWLVFGWLLPSLWFSSDGRCKKSNLVATFVDVGHGTCVLLQMPNGQNVLYDAGTFGAPRSGMRNISSVLWSENIKHLDAVILSHADVDHFNAIPGLSCRFSIGSVYMSPVMKAKKSKAIDYLVSRLEANHVRICELNLGMGLRCSGVKISVLSPPPLGTGGTDNSDSIVMVIDAFGRRILLSGDLEDEGMDLLLERPRIDCDIAMAPHHGSLRSAPRHFVEWCTPEHVVISADTQKVDPRAVELLSQNGRAVQQTGRPGAVRYIIEPDGNLSISVWRKGNWHRKTQ